MSTRCYSAAVHGIHARIIEVEVTIRESQPKVVIVGLPDASVKESRDRVRTAIESSGFQFPASSKVLVNLAPASQRKVGPVYDLPIALGILAAGHLIPGDQLAKYVILGELALDGRVRAVRGALPVAMKAARSDRRALILPVQNAREAGLYPGVKVIPVATLAQAAAFLSGTREIEPTAVDPAPLLDAEHASDLDLSEVRGQELAKRALVVAAAGGHNLLMVGPPGSGKTMLAARLSTILPSLTLAEALETTTVHSVAGELGDGTIVARRPFRAPHHSISMAGLLGGGPRARPGEVSLAHHGVLFLDELPEFDRRTLDALRQPLEDKRVRISRVRYSVRFPARFTLVAAMNPCRCGKYGSDGDACSCTPPQVDAYQNRVSGPLLDRIDLHVEVPKVSFADLAADESGDPSAALRQRVAASREAQTDRLDHRPGATNASMSPKEVRAHCAIDGPSKNLLRNAMEKLGLSARGHDRILRVARTVADLAAAESIREIHLAEALQYRATPPAKR